MAPYYLSVNVINNTCVTCSSTFRTLHHESLVFFPYILSLYLTPSCLMLHIVGASSLYHSTKNLAPEDFTYTGTTHATPSLQLNYRVSDDYNAFRHLNLPETRTKRIVLWHDLINNSITSHWTNNNLPLTANQLVTELRRIPNLHSIIYCHRSGAPGIFQFLLDHLRDLNIVIIDIPKHILSNSNSSTRSWLAPTNVSTNLRIKN